jgi:hypothetical protein
VQSPKVVNAIGESAYVPLVTHVKAAYMPRIEKKVQSPVYNPVTSPLFKTED